MTSKRDTCESCGKVRSHMSTAVVNGIYYKHVCQNCLHGSNDEVSSGVASFERRRGYEDNAQDTVQPYDAAGPNPEFLRLYPKQAEKVFNADTIAKLKRKI